jgi:transcription antitermination factor NusG
MHTHLKGKNVFPQNLLEGGLLDSSDCTRTWWALYTKARQEKALAKDLYAQQIPFYLPVVERMKTYGKRKVRADTVMFTGYVFLLATEDERARSLKTNRISRVLEVPDPLRLQFDLRQLQRVIESGEPLTIEDRLTKGDRVRVKRGHLRGLEGVVLRRRDQTRLLVTVDFLQKGATLVIDADIIEPL